MCRWCPHLDQGVGEADVSIVVRDGVPEENVPDIRHDISHIRGCS